MDKELDVVDIAIKNYLKKNPQFVNDIIYEYYREYYEKHRDEFRFPYNPIDFGKNYRLFGRFPELNKPLEPIMITYVGKKFYQL